MTDDAKKPPRKPTPKEIETEVLANSRRRCALCFYLHGDLEEKHGQVAHLDDDRSNYALDNLAFLCLPHHSVYDSTTSQHKNYTIDEAKLGRAQLYDAIAAGKHHTYKKEPHKPAPGLAADKQTLDELMTLVNSNGNMAWLRSNNFAGLSYAIDRFDGLGTYAERQGAEHEFIDAELEALRKAFHAAATTLLSELGVNTWPTDSGRASIPQEWEIEQPERFNTVVKKVHAGANLVCETYDELVRQAKRKLSP